MWRQRIFGWIGVLVMTGLIGYLVASRWPADPKPAGYTAPTFDEPTDPGHKRAFHEVCPAINRPEVVALLEQPAEVHGQGTSYGTDPGYLSCHVTLKLASLRVDVGDGLTVASMRRVSPDAHDLTVLPPRDAGDDQGPDVHHLAADRVGPGRLRRLRLGVLPQTRRVRRRGDDDTRR